MNPMKRKQEEISGSVRGTSTAPGVTGHNTSTQSERPSKRARTEDVSEINTLGTNARANHVIPHPPILSARAQKRAKVVGEIGSDDKAKGLVRAGLNGLLEHYSDEAKMWMAAVYHNDLRAELIQEAARAGQYEHGRTRGAGTTDITSFLVSQRTWGPERKDWPDVLFQVEVVKRRNLPKNVPFWHHNGRLVIDHDNHPMRDFSGLLPATLSSEAEGWLLEAFTRSDPRVQIKDLRGRMPKGVVVVDRNGVAETDQQTKPLFTPRTITQRTLRFRGQAALKARDVRGGSDAINKGLDALIPAEALKKNNSKELGRLLTSEEVKAFKKPNEGKYPQRGRATKSVTNTSSKRKRDDNYMAGQGGGCKESKRARILENVAYLGEISVLTQGPGLGDCTPELSSTAVSTPSLQDQELSTPGDLGYLPLDPALFPQEEAAFQEWLLQDSTQPLAAPEDDDRWSNLLNLSPQDAYNLMNPHNSGIQGRDVNFDRTYGPITYGQPYHPYVAPNTGQVGGALSHGWAQTTSSVHRQEHQTPGTTNDFTHGHNWEKTRNQNARIAVDSGYAQSYGCSVTGRATCAPINEGALSENFDASAYSGHGPAQQALAPTRTAAMTLAAEENSYSEFGTIQPLMYSQVSTAATEGQDRGYNAGGSTVENTIVRADSSLPITQPRTRPSTRKSRKGAGKAQEHESNLIGSHSTPPVLGRLINHHEQHIGSWDDYPSMPAASNATSNNAYTTYDREPVYYSTSPYYGGGSVEPVGHGHDEEAGGSPAVNEPVDSGLSDIEDFLREAEYRSR